MLVYKGFIKVTKSGVFYPISRIVSLNPVNGNPLKTEICFGDKNNMCVDYPIIKLIDLLNESKEQK